MHDLDKLVQPRHGLRLRAPDPQVLRGLQRDRRRALHPARGHPADGQPAHRPGRGHAHRRRARSSTSSTRPAAPAACSPPPRTTSSRSTRTPRSTCSARSSTPSRGRSAESDMLMRSQRGRIDFGNSFSDDGYPDRKFDYMLANPPFGVEWKKVKDEVEAEAETRPRRPVRCGPAAHQRRLVPVPAAHDLEDGAGRGQGRAAGDRLQRLAAVHRRRPGRASPRSAGGSSRTTGWRASSPCRTSCSTTPASPPTSGSCPTARRKRCAAR